MIVRNESVELITKVVTDAEVKEITTEVFAEKKGVTYREFYAAQQVGMNPRVIFSVDALDYRSAIISGQEPGELIYDKRKFVIVRVYENSNDVELTVSNFV